MARYFIFSGILLWLTSSPAFGQTTPSIAGLPETLSWQNKPGDWHIDDKKVLTITSNAKSDWFVDPFDGTVANTAPILLFTPSPDYVLSTRVTVKFATKWDAGALMLWGDDHHWAKLSFEFSPDGKPTLVTVVTRRAAVLIFSISPRTEKIGKSSARLASIRIFPFAPASNRSRQGGLARSRSFPRLPTMRIGWATFTNNSSGKRREPQGLMPRDI
jgi:hypothetical protein